MEQRRAELESMRHEARRRSAPPLMESRSPIDYLAFNDEPRVFCYRDLVSLTSSTNDALLLSQIVYWFRAPPDDPSDGRQLPRARANFDGHVWVCKSKRALSQETGLNPPKVKRALGALREQGHVETRTHRKRILIRPSSTLNDLISSRQIGDRGVTVYATTVHMTGRAEAALVLSQLCYWASTDPNGRCRMRIFRDGLFWVAKTAHQLGEEVGLRPRQVRCALDRLLQLGVVVKRNWVFAGRRMLHLRLDEEVFSELWMQQKQREYSTEP
jgi:hypothetical protein